MKVTLSFELSTLVWLVVAVALGMGISYWYTGWPVIALVVGVPCGLVSALLFFWADGVFLKRSKNAFSRFFLRVLFMIVLSIATFVVFSFFK